MKKIVVLASGSGSNAENIFSYFEASDAISVVAVITNNSNAGVIERMKPYNCPVHVVENSQFLEDNTDKLLNLLSELEADYIVLAGFLRRIPIALTQAFHNKIINIHPALLPQHGGKGMYGAKVHQAVFDAKDAQSGITIHKVNENYDEGEIIAQFSVAIDSEDTVADIESKVRALEILHFPKTIEKYILK